MNEAISAVLAYAVGVGLSPIPLAAVILVLFSQRARVNGPSYLVGWMIGLATLVTAVQLVAGDLGAGTSSTADDGISWLRILLGVVLLVAAARKWQQSGSEADGELPSWMSRIEQASPFQALGVGLLLSCNPKNLALALGAGLGLAQLDAPVGQRATASAVFVLIGSTLVIVTVGYALIGGAGARQRLEHTKAWLVLHNGAVMAVLFVVFAALLISQGLGLRS